MVAKQLPLIALGVYALFFSVALFIDKIEFVSINVWQYYWVIAVYFGKSFVAGLSRRNRHRIMTLALFPLSYLIVSTLIWLAYSMTISASMIVGVFVLFVPMLSYFVDDLFDTNFWLTFVRYAIEIFVVFPTFMIGVGLMILFLGWTRP